MDSFIREIKRVMGTEDKFHLKINHVEENKIYPIKIFNSENRLIEEINKEEATELFNEEFTNSEMRCHYSSRKNIHKVRWNFQGAKKK